MAYIVSNDEVVGHLRRHTENRKAAAEQAVRNATGEGDDAVETDTDTAGG